MRESITKFFSDRNGLITLRAGLIILALTPLVVTPGLVFPFHTGRTVFFQSLVALLLPLGALVALRDPLRRPARSIVLAALAVFIVAGALSAIVGVDPAQSFWGRDERMMGIFTLLHLVLYAVLLAIAFSRVEEFRVVIVASVSVAVAAALLSIHEHFFPAAWQALALGGGRVSGTLGNPIFLANYLMPHLFLAAYLAPRASKRVRSFLLLAVLVIGAALLYSGTRGALLGAFAGAGAYGVGWIAHTRGRRRAVVALAALATIVVMLGLYIAARQNPRFYHHPTLAPLLQISPHLITVEERLLLWRIALRAIAARPLLGWGAENFDYAFDRNYDPMFLRYSLHETWVDRAHNVFLDAATTGGGLGFLAFLALLTIPSAVIWRRKRDGVFRSGEAIAVGAAASAIIVQNVSAFDTLPSFMVLMLIVALGIVAIRRSDCPSGRVFRALPAVVLIGILVVADLVVNARIVRAARALSDALHAATPAALEASGRIALGIWNPFLPGFRLRFGNAVFLGAGTRFSAEAERVLLDMAADEHRKTLVSSPHDFKNWFSLGNTLFIRAIDVDTTSYPAALEAYRTALTLSPKRQIVLFQIGNLELIRGNADAAVEAFAAAAAADPTSAEPWWHLGRALVSRAATHSDRAAVDETNAYDAFERARSAGYVPITIADVEAALPLYAKRGDYGAALWVAERGTVLKPNDANLWIQVAVLARAAGSPERAREAAERALALDPSLKSEVDAFLKTLSLP